LPRANDDFTCKEILNFTVITTVLQFTVTTVVKYVNKSVLNKENWFVNLSKTTFEWSQRSLSNGITDRRPFENRIWPLIQKILP
jgi:hypothetical protein